MIEVKYVKNLSVYTLSLTDMKLGNNNMVFMKFDTGAINTVINIWNLYKYLSANEKEELKLNLENACLDCREFCAASGSSLKGYPCLVHDVKLSGVLIKDFYFYLTLEGRNTLALLGNDFISCCDFRHLINGDIIIDNFDNVLLCDKFKSQCKKAFELDELVTATLEENETKNIAAAFNALYKEK